jgi:hypothetical protein
MTYILFKMEWSLVMKQLNFCKTLNTTIALGAMMTVEGALADTPQGTHNMGSGMMNGYGYGWMGGSGGIWIPTLLVIVIVGLVAWIIKQKKK